MAIVASGLVHQRKIDLGVSKAVKALKPEVVRIRYTLAEDWSGSAALFFRVVISDEASRKSRLHEVAQRVASTVLEKVRPDELGLQVYFNFRSVSEQQKLREAAWA